MRLVVFAPPSPPLSSQFIIKPTPSFLTAYVFCAGFNQREGGKDNEREEAKSQEQRSSPPRPLYLALAMTPSTSLAATGMRVPGPKMAAAPAARRKS